MPRKVELFSLFKKAAFGLRPDLYFCFQMPFVDVSKVQFSFSKFKLRPLSFSMEQGDLLSVVGHSGSGKTTLLRLILGDLKPESGSIDFDFDPKPGSIAYLPQDFKLSNWYTVSSHLNKAVKHLPKEERPERLEEIIRLTDIRDLMLRRPSNLSGGEKQRVALAKALCAKPQLLLLDEPYTGLDNIMRQDLRTRVREILLEAGVTTIVVTHDIEDALTTTDHMIILKDGWVKQQGAPRDIYHFPRTRYVAKLFGRVNLLKAKVTNAGLQTNIGYFPNTLNEAIDADREVWVAFRPESVKVSFDPKVAFKARVKHSTFLGDKYEVVAYIRYEGRKAQRITFYQYQISKEYKNGETVYLEIRSDEVCVMKHS